MFHLCLLKLLLCHRSFQRSVQCYPVVCFFIATCSCAVILMFVVKFTEVKETHRCYRQDVADTLVSFCNSSMLWFFQFVLMKCIHVTDELKYSIQYLIPELVQAWVSLSPILWWGSPQTFILTSTCPYPFTTPFFSPLFNAKSIELLTGSGELAY